MCATRPFCHAPIGTMARPSDSIAADIRVCSCNARDIAPAMPGTLQEQTRISTTSHDPLAPQTQALQAPSRPLAPLSPHPSVTHNPHPPHESVRNAGAIFLLTAATSLSGSAFVSRFEMKRLNIFFGQCTQERHSMRIPWVNLF